MKHLDNVIYEDNHLLVLNKPANLLTQPADESTSLETYAKAYIKEKYLKPGDVFLHAVHRLDKPVSGIVVFAKTSKALSRLNETIRNRNCEKIYLAHVSKILPKEGVLKHRIEHGEHKAFESESGKEAILYYKQVKGALYEIKLETGRYHQIRLQLALAGAPIVGDEKYGGPKAERLFLHHWKMSFKHPTLDKLLHFETPIPEGF